MYPVYCLEIWHATLCRAVPTKSNATVYSYICLFGGGESTERRRCRLCCCRRHLCHRCWLCRGTAAGVLLTWSLRSVFYLVGRGLEALVPLLLLPVLCAVLFRGSAWWYVCLCSNRGRLGACTFLNIFVSYAHSSVADLKLHIVSPGIVSLGNNYTHNLSEAFVIA